MEGFLQGLLDTIRRFCPIWFSLSMATGIIPSLWHNFPFGGDHSRGLNLIALVFYIFNLSLFTVFLSCAITRYILFPRTWRTMLLDPSETFYWGLLPMAGATIINVSLSVVHQYWGFGGTKYLYLLWSLWWIDIVLSFVCAFGLVYVMSAHLQLSISSVTPGWLLPVMTLIVASTTGQQLAGALIPISPSHTFITISISLLMLSIGSVIVFMLLTLWIRRLLIDGFPDIMASSSIFIPLGPCGQTGYSLLLAGQNFSALLPYGSDSSILGDPLIGRILHAICFSFAFAFWSLELWWLLTSVMTLIHLRLNGARIHFNLSWWAVVFPNGVYALLTLELSNLIESRVFKIFGAIHAILIVILWTILAIRTSIQLIKDTVFQPSPEGASSPNPFIQIKKELTKTSTAIDRETGSMTQV